jgi:hypothetical protein
LEENNPLEENYPKKQTIQCKIDTENIEMKYKN